MGWGWDRKWRQLGKREKKSSEEANGPEARRDGSRNRKLNAFCTSVDP